MTFTYQASFSWLSKKCYFITNLITFDVVLNVCEECVSANAGKNTKNMEGPHLLELLTNAGPNYTIAIPESF